MEGPSEPVWIRRSDRFVDQRVRVTELGKAELALAVAAGDEVQLDIEVPEGLALAAAEAGCPPDPRTELAGGQTQGGAQGGGHQAGAAVQEADISGTGVVQGAVGVHLAGKAGEADAQALFQSRIASRQSSFALGEAVLRRRRVSMVSISPWRARSKRNPVQVRGATIERNARAGGDRRAGSVPDGGANRGGPGAGWRGAPSAARGWRHGTGPGPSPVPPGQWPGPPAGGSS